MAICNRFSSRRTKLDQTFLNQRLQGAQAYNRIAGYFRSSILEVAGEALESITGQIRVICNSDLNVQDVDTAKAANYAMRREWCAADPEKYSEKAKPRFARLYQFLRSGKMQVKVLPREKFGLVHGKAGVVTTATGVKTSFMGSTNETYECIIVDEAHRAPRANLGLDREPEKSTPNNLLSFLCAIAPRTKSLLLATATPVQMYPLEAWDLLNVLAIANEAVLGNDWSNWRRANEALLMAMGQAELPEDDQDRWRWIRNPLPPASEGIDFRNIRRTLKVSDDVAVVPGDSWNKLRNPDKDRICRLARDFGPHHNPFIRHIVRRTRDYLENTIDPETNEPYLKPVKVKLYGETDRDSIPLPLYLRDAYAIAEEFCDLLGQRMKGSGFLRTLLLRRVGSTICAGMNTAKSMLGAWEDIEEDDEDAVSDDKPKSLTPSERDKLEQFLDKLEANQEDDPKYEVVRRLLIEEGWLEEGCIIFSQYFDSIRWLADQLSRDLSKGEAIGIYAGGQKSGVLVDGVFTRERESLKQMVRRGEMRLLLGTDAASEGLNLQRLGTLINLDLPWNPTRLEQRKGRIQRIGQLRDVVHIYNMRYKGSVEDRVHELLSDRLEAIHQLFGQIPDVLEDVWVQVAQGKIEEAKQTINAVPQKHPFEFKYHQVKKVPWESCATVLSASDRRQHLLQGW